MIGELMNKPLLALLALSTCSPLALAASANNTSSNTSSNTEAVLVTATRTAQSVDTSLAAVAVIERQQIEQLQPSDLLQLLASTPGVDVSRNGGRGASASLFLRGTNNGHALVLIDGVRMGSATLGTVSLQNIDPAQVERIEIVRGPRSSLYGSEALGGVIQVFTRKPADFAPVVTLAYGTDNTREASLAAGGKWGETSVGVSISSSQSDGIDSQLFDGNTDADDDENSSSSLALTLAHRFEGGAELSFNSNRASGDKDFDQGDSYYAVAEASPYNKFEVTSLNAALAVPLTASWLSTVSMGYVEDQSETRDHNIADGSEFTTERDQASWQNDIQLNDNYLLTLGYDYYRDEVVGSQSYAQTERSNRALFGQMQGQLPADVDIVVGYRRDKNDQFGYETTYNIALGVDLGAAHRLIVSRGTAFKAPTFNDLYWPADQYSAGNSNLAPEESDHIELELRGSYADLTWSLTAYRNDIDNLINWAETSPGFWQPSNVNAAEILGSEFSLRTQLGDWNVQTSISYVKPENADNGNLLARRAEKTALAQLDRQFGKMFVAVNWKAQSHRYDDVANSKRLPGYNTVAVSLSYEISEKLTSRLKLDNIFDSDYQLSKNYHTAGSEALLSLTYSL